MKIVLVIVALVVAHTNAVFAADKKVNRNPSSVTCIRSPTLDCIPGYIPRDVKGCFKCVSAAVDPSNEVAVDEEASSCITVRTLTCAPGYRQTAETTNGKTCYHCTMPAITEPTCIRTPTIECNIKDGYHESEDENKCFHCVK